MEELKDLFNFSYVVIDKPYGPTSHQVSAWVKEILNVKKTGHAGTLDPHVTGVLPIGINKATRIINILHMQDKEYVGLLYLHGNVNEKKIREVFSEFIGEIYQMVPVRAAVSRKLRKRKIFSLEIIEIDGRNVLFKVSTESGTYIRTLCVDLGDAIGTGGNLVELRRIRTGRIKEENAFTLQDLKDAMEFFKNGDNSYLKKILRPGKELTDFLPKIIVKETAIEAIVNGAPLYSAGVEKVEGNLSLNSIVAIFSPQEELISLGKVVNNLDISSKDPIVKMETVIMERGKYPKTWKLWKKFLILYYS
ncbi:MAG: RNA-guided pseudouridylation complex pseudouridine synthase subunit Cbf5 [Thermoplasmata archaeon]